MNPAVQHALDLLAADPELSVAEVSRRTGVPRTTIKDNRDKLRSMPPPLRITGTQLSIDPALLEVADLVA